MGQLDDREVQASLAREGIRRDSVVSAQIDQNNREFANSMDWKITEGKGLQPVGAADRRRHQLVMEAWKTLQKSGWEFATVVNLLPWEITIRPPYGIYTIPAPNKKKNEAYHMYTVKVPAMPVRDLGDAMFYPTPILPIEIAQEFEAQNLENGGVFYFRGDNPPESFGEMLELGRQKMRAGMEKRIMDAQSNWLRTNKNPRVIDPNDKLAARWLFDQGFIDQMPEWTTLTRDESVTTSCPFCFEPIRKGANVCKHCSRDLTAAPVTDAPENSVEEITKRVMAEITKKYDLVPKPEEVDLEDEAEQVGAKPKKEKK